MVDKMSILKKMVDEMSMVVYEKNTDTSHRPPSDVEVFLNETQIAVAPLFMHRQTNPACLSSRVADFKMATEPSLADANVKRSNI